MRDVGSSGSSSQRDRDRPTATIVDLYTTEREALLRYATGLTRERSKAEDLIQDAFVRAMSHPETLADLTRAQQKAWLYRVIRNRFIDQSRRAVRWGAIETELRRAAGRPDDSVLTGVRRWEILNAVPAKYRDVLHYRFVLGMNSTEIGERLGVPPGTVRSRLRLAFAWMRVHRERLFGKE